MDRIALIVGEYVIYWRPLLMSAAAVTAACIFVSLYLIKGGSGLSAALAVPVAIALGTACSRFVHWYCRFENYAGLLSAMTDYSSGGYALVGVFAGCLLTALLLRLTSLSRDLGKMLDCMCIAGAGGIAIGRLASLFDNSDRGPILESLQGLPWVYPVINPVSGIQEYRLATFMIQAIIAAAIFLFLLIFYLIPRKKRPLPNYDITLFFLLLYGTSQAVLDSTRYDSLFFRSNGFVSVVQVLSAVVVVFTVVVFSGRMVKNRGMHRWYFALWGLIAGMLGMAGYMEYYVQRHGSEAPLAYSVMSGSLAVVIVAVSVIWVLSFKKGTVQVRTGRYLSKNRQPSGESPSQNPE